MEQIWVCIEKICWKTWQISKHLQIVVAFWLCQMIVFSPLVVCMVVHLEMFWLWTTYLYIFHCSYLPIVSNKQIIAFQKKMLASLHLQWLLSMSAIFSSGHFAPYQCWNLMCSSHGYEGLVMFMFCCFYLFFI